LFLTYQLFCVTVETELNFTRQERVMNEKRLLYLDRKTRAYHEAGHVAIGQALGAVPLEIYLPQDVLMGASNTLDWSADDGEKIILKRLCVYVAGGLAEFHFSEHFKKDMTAEKFAVIELHIGKDCDDIREELEAAGLDAKKIKELQQGALGVVDKMLATEEIKEKIERLVAYLCAPEQQHREDFFQDEILSVLSGE